MASTYIPLRFRCTVCNGTGVFPSEFNLTCPSCVGTGYSDSRLDFETTELLDKIQEVKTKINQMQADINYIKAKVG